MREVQKKGEREIRQYTSPSSGNTRNGSSIVSEVLNRMSAETIDARYRSHAHQHRNKFLVSHPCQIQLWKSRSLLNLRKKRISRMYRRSRRRPVAMFIRKLLLRQYLLSHKCEVRSYRRSRLYPVSAKHIEGSFARTKSRGRHHRAQLVLSNLHHDMSLANSPIYSKLVHRLTAPR